MGVRHIIDRPKTRSDRVRLRQALRQSQAATPHPVAASLHRQKRGGSASALLRAFLRIERGIGA